MRSRFRATFVAAATAALVIGSTGLAHADDVIVGPDVTRAPGETATFLVGLIAQDDPDPMNNCNANNGNQVTVQFTSSKAQVVAAPGSIELKGCDDPGTPNVIENAVTVSYTVSSSAAAGEAATITATASGGRSTGNPKVYGTFNPDSITISVATPLPPDSTAPVITPIVTGTQGQNGWYTSDVTVAWSVSDDEGPITSSTGCESTTISTDTAGRTLTCTATSAGGTSSESVPVKRDATAPTVQCAAADGAWHADNVSLGCTASDGGSGLAETDKSFSLSTSVAAAEETRNASTGSRTVTDAAGNSAAAGPIAGNKVDRKAPEVSCGSDSGEWHADNVAVACTATDAGSGLADSGDAAFTLSTTVAAGTETDSASTGSRQVADAVGNTVTVDAVSGIKVDRKAPVVTCDPVDDKWSKSDVVFTCSAVDSGSGVAEADKSFTLSTNVADGEETDDAETGSHDVADAVGNTVQVGPFTGNKVDKKAPQVSCGTDDGTWHAGNVDIACTSTDGGSDLADSGDEAFTLSTNVSDGEETSNASTGSRDVADAVGNTSTAGPISGIRVDRKAPAVRCDPVDSVWHTDDVTLTCTAVDNGSGLADKADETFTLSTDVAQGEETDNASTGSRIVSDAVGNEVTVGPFTGIKVDKKAPTVGCDEDDGSWHGENVTLTCWASDLGSGLADSADESFTLSTNVAEGEETDNASTDEHVVSDALGHTAKAGPISGIKVDRKAPTIEWSVDSIEDFYFGDHVDAPTCTAADGGSGLDGGCSVSGFSTAVGTHTLTATAKDNVDNVGTSTLTYTVRAWRLDGFYKPVDMGLLNTVKSGSTVPLKFNVFKGADRMTSGIGATFSAKRVTCGGTAAVDAIEEFQTTGKTELRYDPTAQQWIQNWATPKDGAGSCYKVTLTTADGKSVTADFKLMK